MASILGAVLPHLKTAKGKRQENLPGPMGWSPGFSRCVPAKAGTPTDRTRACFPPANSVARNGVSKTSRGFLGLTRLHLVANRLLGARDRFHGPPGGGDLL